MIWMVFIVAALPLLMAGMKQKDSLAFIRESSQAGELQNAAATKALNVTLLTDKPLRARFRIGVDNFKVRVGKHYQLKLASLLLADVVISLFVQSRLVDARLIVILPVVILLSLVGLVRALQLYERKMFDESFPDALNLLAGAIGSGESLMHAIRFVGNSLDNAVGDEFRLMGQRLSLGQSPEAVLRKACQRFPYPPFYFFVITLHANMKRGGQLKDIIKGLNKVMFNSYALQKKKNAMTAEARSSAKIVAAIPLVFLFLMQYLSPENFDFIMNHEDGRNILHYVLISECIGFGIIWMLLKRIKG